MRIFWSALTVTIVYSAISATTPAPTVRPPSRIANRSSFSIATGWINSIVIVTLFPRITLPPPPPLLPPPPPPHSRQPRIANAPRLHARDPPAPPDHPPR